jgi:hypothetical protein
VVAAVCALATGCGSGDVDGTVLEGIRMSDAVADTSQFGSALNYLGQAGPVPDTASIVPIVGETGKRVLDGLGW